MVFNSNFLSLKILAFSGVWRFGVGFQLQLLHFKWIFDKASENAELRDVNEILRLGKFLFKTFHRHRSNLRILNYWGCRIASFSPQTYKPCVFHFEWWEFFQSLYWVLQLRNFGMSSWVTSEISHSLRWSKEILKRSKFVSRIQDSF